MRIAVIDALLYTPPYDKELCAALAGLGHTVFLLGAPGGRLAQDWKAAGIEFVSVPVDSFWSTDGLRHFPHWAKKIIRRLRYAFQIRRIEKICQQLRPDVVHFQWLLVPLAELPVIARIQRFAPCILTVHDTVVGNGDRRSRLETAGFARALARFDRLIVHTNGGKSRLEAIGVDRARIDVIPHGVLPHASPSDRPSTGCPDPAVRFLMFGNLKFYKGIDILIRAAQRIPQGVLATCRFRIAGRAGTDIAGLEQLARDCGVADRFEFDVRHVSDEEVPALFAGSDVVVFPYREVEASGALMLALNFARPIVASRVGLFKELLVEGKHALLTPPDDPDSLAAALTRIATDPDLRQAMGREIEELRGQVPSWKEIAERTVAAYLRTRTSGGRAA